MKKFSAILILALMPGLAWAEFEPNDEPAGADRLFSGVSMPGQLSHRNDVDRFVVNAVKSTEIALTFNRTAGDESEGLWKVSIFRGSDNIKVASFESWLDDPEIVRIGASETGDYSIVVEQGFFHSTDQYEITATSVSENFDGIWQTDAGDYVSMHQRGEQLIAVIMGDPDSGWEAQSGTVSEATAEGPAIATTRTIIGIVDLELQIVLDAFDSFTATQVSCEPVDVGATCAFPDGHVFTGTRIF